MRTKIIISIVLVVAIGYWFISTDVDIQVIKKTTSEVQPIKQKQYQQSIKKPPSIKPKQKLKSLQVPEDITQELSQQKYSSDQLLEAVTVIKLIYDCERKHYLNNNVNQSSNKYKALFLKKQKSCNEIKSDYPIVSNLDKNKELETMIAKIAIQSDYADFFQKLMIVKFMSDKEQQIFLNDSIKVLINTRNAPFIALLGEIPFTMESQLFYSQLFEILGTVNPNYTQLILDQSSTLFSCQYSDGISCSPTSSYMLQRCVKNESACGLDVQTWFQNYHTPAHNRDIAKLVAFLESQVE